MTSSTPPTSTTLRGRGHRGLRVPADGDGWEGQPASPAPPPERRIIAPERSLEQRLDALKKANGIRSSRAALKRDLKARRVSIEHLLDHPDCATMKVIDALVALPKVGRVKAHRALATATISPSKSLGGLTERQRGALLALLPGTSPRMSDDRDPAPIQQATPAQRAIGASLRGTKRRRDRGDNELLADIRRA